MITLFEKLFSLRRDEMKQAAPFLLLLVCLFSGVTVVRNVAMSLVVADFGKDALPLMFALIGVFQLIGSVFYASLSERTSPGVLYRGLLVSLAVFCLLCFGLMLLKLKIASALLYVGVFVLLPVVAMHDGTHLGAYLNAYEQKRLAGFISAGIPLGAMLGGAVLFLLLGVVAPVWLLLIMPLSAGLTMAVVGWVSRQRESLLKPGAPVARKNPLRQMGEGVKASAGVPLLRWLAAGVFLSTLLQQFMVYFYQGVIYPQQFPHPADRAAFFGKYDLIMNLLALSFQLLVASRLISRLGVGLSSLLHPVLYLGAAGVLVASQGLWAGIFAQAINQELRTYFRKPVDNLLFNGLASRFWGVAKAFLGGVVQPVAIVLSTLVLVALRQGFGTDWMNEVLKFLMVVVALAGVVLIFPQWRAYDHGVLGLLKKRGLPTDRMGELPPALVAAQAGELLKDDSHTNVLLGLELLRQLKRPEDIPKVAAILADTENRAVAEACLETLGCFPGEEAAFAPLFEALQKFEGHPEMNALVAESLRFLAPYDRLEVVQEALKLLHDPATPADELGAAARCLMQSSHFSETALLKNRALEILSGEDSGLKTTALDMLALVGETDVQGAVLPFLDHPGREVRAAAVRTLAALFPAPEEPLRQQLLARLHDTQPPVRLEAVQFVAHLDTQTEAVLRAVLPLLADQSPRLSALAQQFFAARLALADTVLQEALFSQATPFALRQRVLHLLLSHADEAFNTTLEKSALSALGRVLRCQATSGRVQQELKNSDMLHFLQKAVSQVEREHVLFAVVVLTALSGQSDDFFQRVSLGLYSGNKQDRGLALEAVSQLRQKSLATPVLKVLEEMPLTSERAAALHQQLFGAPLVMSKTLAEDLSALDDVHLRAAAWRLGHTEAPTDPALKALLG